MRLFKTFLLSTGAAMLCFVPLRAGDAPPQGSGAASWLAKLRVERGICVVLGDSSCRLALEIARRGKLLVYTQVSGEQDVEKARRAAAAARLGATRFQVERGPLSHLHLAGDIADALIAVGDAARIDEMEALRVVRPRGKAFLGPRTLVKPVREGADDWSHLYHGPDNNPLSRDRVARAPYLTQFLADPRYGPAPQAAVAAGGRVFKAFGNVAWHEREEPYLNTLAAFNGYNGTLLWKRSLPEGMMVHRSTWVATDDTLYYGDDTSCKILDAATGKLRGEIRPPVDTAGGTFWKWLALEKDTLYALTGQQELKDPVTKWKRTAHGWPWNGISKGYNLPRNPWGFGRNLLAIDPATRNVIWSHREKEPADARALCMKDGRIFLFSFGAYLTAIDAASGKPLWRKTPDNYPALFQALDKGLERQSWQTNWRTTNYLKCTGDALYFAGPQMRELLAVSTRDGRILWQDPYDNYQIVIRDDALYAISGPWGNNVSRKLEPLTGKVLAELPTGRRACTRPTGTADSIIYRAMGGSVRFDVASSRPRWVSPMRPPCHDGVTVANGLVYWFPYVCDCQLSLYGVIAAGPAEHLDFTPDFNAPSRREVPGNAALEHPLPASPLDWPTFRATAERTAVTRAKVPARAGKLWSTAPPAVAGTRPTAPVAAAGLVFCAGSDGVVRAFDAATGQPSWTARTGGEIRLPPTIADGRAFVGSGDGWVYAFEASSGRLLWRFRAAPYERKIPVFGKLLSTWPAASGVLVEGGTAYVAAGLANYDGTYVYALDAGTGKVRWCNDTSGHLDPAARTGVGVQGHLLLHAATLYLAGGNAVSPGKYDIRDGRCLNDPAPLARCESTSPRGWELYLMGDRVFSCGRPFYARPEDAVYDHTVTKKALHAPTGKRDVVWIDNRTILCFEPLPTGVLSRCVTDEKIPRHITQAWGAFRVPQKPLWRQDRPGGIALAAAPNAVVLASGRQLEALDIADGRTLWEQTLEAAPVPWGLAVDRDGRVIVTLVDGRLACFGKPRTASAY